jgi:hypothetical protein
MNRYFILKDLETLEVVGAPFETQPENSLPYTINELNKPCFDVYPNPTTIVEGSQEPIIPITPQEVQLWRIRTVLRLMNLEDTIATALDQLEEPTKTGAKTIWEFGTTIERNSQTVLFLQYVLQMTDLQVDNIFIQAEQIAI